MNAWLENVPPPEWTKRPNAKDRLRDMARKMREEGRTYDEIAEAVGDTYHGCLIVSVRQSADLYRHIEAVAKALLAGMSDAQADPGAIA